jgi:hypothetical protein
MKNIREKQPKAAEKPKTPRFCRLPYSPLNFHIIDKK